MDPREPLPAVAVATAEPELDRQREQVQEVTAAGEHDRGAHHHDPDAEGRGLGGGGLPVLAQLGQEPRRLRGVGRLGGWFRVEVGVALDPGRADEDLRPSIRFEGADRPDDGAVRADPAGHDRPDPPRRPGQRAHGHAADVDDGVGAGEGLGQGLVTARAGRVPGDRADARREAPADPAGIAAQDVDGDAVAKRARR